MRMRFQILWSLAIGVVVTGAWAQTTVEPADFNVTEALLNHGVDVASIPALAGLVERSSNSACSIAVCSHMPQSTSIILT
jgi:hypothetical protein